MKKFLQFLFIFAFAVIVFPKTAYADVAINETNFPDARFRECIANCDSWNYDCSSDTWDSDGILTDAEIRRIDELNIHGPVSSLKGIEYLTSLTYIHLEGVKIGSIDFGTNPSLITIDWYELNPCTTNISFSKNPNLESVDIEKAEGCNGYNLGSLDFSKCPKLSSLDVSDGIGLKYINLTNTAYDSLDEDNGFYYNWFGKNVKVIRGNYDERGNYRVKFVRYGGKYVAVKMNGKAFPWEFYMEGERTVNYNGYCLHTNKGVFERITGFDIYGDYYFVNGVAPRGDMFIDEYNNGYLRRITNGKANYENGFVRYRGRYVFSYHGRPATSYTGWITYEGYRCYLQRGVLRRCIKM